MHTSALTLLRMYVRLCSPCAAAAGPHGGVGHFVAQERAALAAERLARDAKHAAEVEAAAAAASQSHLPGSRLARSC
jgi:hypothetical protein